MNMDHSPPPPPPPPPPASFRSPSFLLSQLQSCVSFYTPHCVDSRGGFYHCYTDDGHVYDRDIRHIVSSTRFIIIFCWTYQLTQDPQYLPLIQHGLSFLRQRHYNDKTGGYRWTINMGEGEEDERNFSYGFAFCLLTYATALQCHIPGVSVKDLEDVCQVWDSHLWEETHGLYADEAAEDWSSVSNYRGQNCNMHAVEAHLAAYDATGRLYHLNRAQTIANKVCNTLTQVVLADTGLELIYEHYTSDWAHADLDYNKDKPNDVFKPWGFQPGHLVEWAKLLLLLDERRSEDWLLPRAVHLFSAALKYGWDEQYEGLVYSFAPSAYNPVFVSSDKYKWVQAETVATAARLACRTSDSKYWEWYDRIWAYCWRHLIDHVHGAWYRLISRENKKYDNLKSPPGKVDYHNISACRECFQLLTQQQQQTQEQQGNSTDSTAR